MSKTLPEEIVSKIVLMKILLLRKEMGWNKINVIFKYFNLYLKKTNTRISNSLLMYNNIIRVHCVSFYASKPYVWLKCQNRDFYVYGYK